MAEIKHFSHKHPLILSKYNNSPADALCYGCRDPIIINTYVYNCSTTPSPRFKSRCTDYFLHETCSILPPNIQHDLHIEHMLTLQSHDYMPMCKICFNRVPAFAYDCTSCFITICLKCSLPKRDLNHASHIHTLTLLPMKSLHFCGACGTKSSEDFSYLCKTCLFWIHKSCATALPELIFKAHHHDHPLVLDYSLPEAYQRFRVSCDLCHDKIHPSLWLYYCADCRYFAHLKCVSSAIESGEDLNMPAAVVDADDPDLVHFPISDNKPFLLYQLIQKFAENFSTSTDERSEKADKISHCRNGHLLVLFDDFHNNNDVGSERSDHMICDGCVQPIILSPPDSFYGCHDCNFFLHSICAAELPREIQHASHPEHKLIRCDQIGKPNAFFFCSVCNDQCNGMFYSCDSCHIRIDLMCTAMPSEIKHDSHKHKLKFSCKFRHSPCDGCSGTLYLGGYTCEICKYRIHIGCARKPGRIMHRWDEHQLCLMYPPVKGHPHDFNCERCSEDINPNIWFYHCRKCDTSFDVDCLDRSGFTNIKFGGIVKDDYLHKHGLKIAPPGPYFKCGTVVQEHDKWERWPILTCVSCKFSVCGYCTYRNGKYGKLRYRPPRSKTKTGNLIKLSALL